MNVVKCNIGCEHPACEICGTTDPDSGLTHDYWPFGVRTGDTGSEPTMTTCLPCRNAVFQRINTVGKIRLLIGLEQRVSVPDPARPPRPAIPEEYSTRDTVTNSSPLATAETQALPVAS